MNISEKTPNVMLRKTSNGKYNYELYLTEKQSQYRFRLF